MGNILLVITNIKATEKGLQGKLKNYWSRQARALSFSIHARVVIPRWWRPQHRVPCPLFISRHFAQQPGATEEYSSHV